MTNFESSTRELTVCLDGISGVVSDPTIRLNLLEQANRAITSCAPQAQLEEVVSLMIMEDFSQIPILTGPRDLKGVVTWRGIASAAVWRKPHHVAQDVMVPAEEVPIDAALSDVIPHIARTGYVLVRTQDKRISGIVTSSDLNDILLRQSGAFLSLAEIEGYLRLLLHNSFTKDELKAVSQEDGREISSPHDLTLGELIVLIGKPNNWLKLNLPLERADFIKKLNKVNSIRNNVMHFDPKGIKEDDQLFLKKILKLLRDVMPDC